jgi:hypothetical protein
MTDDLVKRLRKTTQSGKPTQVSKADRLAAADRIEELEAKLAKAVVSLKTLEDASKFFGSDRQTDYETLKYAHETTRRLCRTTLAEIEGGKT